MAQLERGGEQLSDLIKLAGLTELCPSDVREMVFQNLDDAWVGTTGDDHQALRGPQNQRLFFNRITHLAGEIDVPAD